MTLMKVTVKTIMGFKMLLVKGVLFVYVCAYIV
uniref:Uncharacterized protein n=1 Tax=Anguilla anguilla TaxID=7936 RepID=A0A0E9PSP0_ANGAN